MRTLSRRSRSAHVPDKKGQQSMISPDQYYAIMNIMRYGSLALACVFASKIIAYAVAS
jgi:hypothetical protein